MVMYAKEPDTGQKVLRGVVHVVKAELVVDGISRRSALLEEANRWPRQINNMDAWHALAVGALFARDLQLLLREAPEIGRYDCNDGVWRRLKEDTKFSYYHYDRVTYSRLVFEIHIWLSSTLHTTLSHRKAAAEGRSYYHRGKENALALVEAWKAKKAAESESNGNGNGNSDT